MTPETQNTPDEVQRLNQATNETLGSSAAYAFKDTPAGNYAQYLLRRWRELATANPPDAPAKKDFAPHPLGAVLGPAAIKPRRKEPLLVAEIIRLLERHGVPWDQAVREAAGLMAQTIEEAEGWWAFEMADVDSPFDEEMIRLKRLESRPSDSGELELSLDEFQIALEERHAAGSERSARRCIKARASVLDLFARLQSSNDQYEESLEARHAEIELLRSTALTRDEAAAILDVLNDGYDQENVYFSPAITKLRSLSSLRSSSLQNTSD